MKRSTSRTALAWILPLLVAAISVTTPGFACDRCGNHGCRNHHGYIGHGRWFDGSTRAAWSVTWHQPTSLDTPLTPYFIPRTPAEGCYTEAEAVLDAGQTESAVGVICDGRAFPELEPARFERIGQIPNEVDMRLDPAAVQPGR
jgi:hypothetical protein